MRQVGVDFAKHAESMGALAERVSSIADLEQAFERARKADRTYVIEIKVEPLAMDAGRRLVGRRRARGQFARERAQGARPITPRARRSSGSEV